MVGQTKNVDENGSVKQDSHLWAAPALSRSGRFIFSSRPPYPSRSALCQLGMIFVLPHSFLVLQKLQKPLAADFIAGGIHKKCTPASRAHQFVDFLDQVFAAAERGYDVCP
jgi:hypothetical protein